MKKRRIITPSNKRKHNLWTRYRLTPEEYDSMHEEARGRCAICKRKRSLCVDHCHKTGKVRGLLCRCCNRGIGMLGDTHHELEKAVEYLRPFAVRHTRRPTKRSAKLSRNDRKQRPASDGRDAGPSTAPGRKGGRSGFHGREAQQPAIRPDAERPCPEHYHARKKGRNKPQR